MDYGADLSSNAARHVCSYTRACAFTRAYTHAYACAFIHAPISTCTRTVPCPNAIVRGANLERYCSKVGPCGRMPRRVMGDTPALRSEKL